LPGAWAGPEVDSVGKMYLKDLEQIDKSPLPLKMTANQGPQDEGPKPEAGVGGGVGGQKGEPPG
jgi:hypothetical protein